MRENLIKRFLSISWDKTRVSVHASNPQTYERVNGVNNFHTALDNIQKFLTLRTLYKNGARSRISIFMVIQKANYTDVYKFAKLAEKLGCDSVEFDTIYPYTKFMVLNKNEIQNVTSQLRNVSKKLRIQNNAEHAINLYTSQPLAGENGVEAITYYKTRMCVIPTQSMILDSFGHTHPCCFLDNSEPENDDCGGFRRVGSVWTIWKRPSYRKIKKNLRSGRFFKTCIHSCNYALPKRN